MFTSSFFRIFLSSSCFPNLSSTLILSSSLWYCCLHSLLALGLVWIAGRLRLTLKPGYVRLRFSSTSPHGHTHTHTHTHTHKYTQLYILIHNTPAQKKDIQRGLECERLDDAHSYCRWGEFKWQQRKTGSLVVVTMEVVELHFWSSVCYKRTDR